MVRRPNVSENDDHQRGNIDIASMYSATAKLVIVGDECRSSAICSRAAVVLLVSLWIAKFQNQ